MTPPSEVTGPGPQVRKRQTWCPVVGQSVPILCYFRPFLPCIKNMLHIFFLWLTNGQELLFFIFYIYRPKFYLFLFSHDEARKPEWEMSCAVLGRCRLEHYTIVWRIKIFLPSFAGVEYVSFVLILQQWAVISRLDRWRKLSRILALTNSPHSDHGNMKNLYPLCTPLQNSMHR